MTRTEAQDILIRVRAGDKTPTRAEITMALILTGDITSLLSTLAQDE